MKNYKSLVSQIEEKLRKEIIEGLLRPQERIIEEEVAKRFKVSRSPVREAFRILEAKALVNVFPRRGVLVSDINLEDVLAISEIRPSLEGLAVKLACRNSSPKDLDRLLMLNDKMDRAATEGDFRLYFKLNKDFHNETYTLTKNKYLIQMLKLMTDTLLRTRFIQLVYLKRVKRSQNNHLKLLEAFREKDEKKAEKYRYKQVERQGKSLIETLSLKLS